MTSKAALPVIRGIEQFNGPQRRGYCAGPPGDGLGDCPELAENPTLLYTLAYSELIESLADTLFPPNTVTDSCGQQVQLTASTARVDRHIHFRAAWQPPFALRMQLALRDLTQASLNRFNKHFRQLGTLEREDILSLLQKGNLPSTEWTTLRSQSDAFNAIYEGVSCGLMAEPGYGGNANGLGWFYTSFMEITE